MKAQPLALGGLEILGLALLQEEVRGQQVHVLERAVDRVGMPFRGVEPLVAGAPGPGCDVALASPHQRAAASFQASTADFTICRFSSAIAGSARPGSAMPPQPDGAQGAHDLRPVDRDHLMQRVGVPRPIDRAQHRVLVQQRP